jgi:recombinational DNA repair protein (RecF pathway)
MDSNNLRKSEINRCVVCGGKFGLVRYYTWRNAALCSQRCRSRTKTREVDSLKWLIEMRSA